MNEKTGTGVSSEQEKVKEFQSRSVTPSLETPSGAGMGRHNVHLRNNFHYSIKFSINILAPPTLFPNLVLQLLELSEASFTTKNRCLPTSKICC